MTAPRGLPGSDTRRDPIAALVAAVHHRATLAWSIEHAPDGNLAAAWASSADPAAMVEVLGVVNAAHALDAVRAVAKVQGRRLPPALRVRAGARHEAIDASWRMHVLMRRAHLRPGPLRDVALRMFADAIRAAVPAPTLGQVLEAVHAR